MIHAMLFRSVFRCRFGECDLDKFRERILCQDLPEEHKYVEIHGYV